MHKSSYVYIVFICVFAARDLHVYRLSALYCKEIRHTYVNYTL